MNFEKTSNVLRGLRVLLTLILIFRGIVLLEKSGSVDIEMFRKCLGGGGIDEHYDSHVYKWVGWPLISIWIAVCIYIGYRLERNASEPDPPADGKFNKTLGRKEYIGEKCVELFYECGITTALIVAVVGTLTDYHPDDDHLKAGFWLLVVALFVSFVTMVLYCVVYFKHDALIMTWLFLNSSDVNIFIAHPRSQHGLRLSPTLSVHALVPGERDWAMRV